MLPNYPHPKSLLYESDESDSEDDEPGSARRKVDETASLLPPMASKKKTIHVSKEDAEAANEFGFTDVKPGKYLYITDVFVRDPLVFGP